MLGMCGEYHPQGAVGLPLNNCCGFDQRVAENRSLSRPRNAFVCAEPFIKRRPCIDGIVHMERDQRRIEPRDNRPGEFARGSRQKRLLSAPISSVVGACTEENIRLRRRVKSLINEPQHSVGRLCDGKVVVADRRCNGICRTP